MSRTIKVMELKYLTSSLDLVEQVFSEWDSPEEGRKVRSLVEEIREKKYYLPELELIMTDEDGQVIRSMNRSTRGERLVVSNVSDAGAESWLPTEYAIM